MTFSGRAPVRQDRKPRRTARPARGRAHWPILMETSGRVILYFESPYYVGSRFYCQKRLLFRGRFNKMAHFGGRRNVVEIFLAFLIFGLLGLILIFMNKLLGPSRPNPAKEQPFECGSPYPHKGINPFPIQV